MVIENDPQSAELMMDYLRAENFATIWHKHDAKITEAIKSNWPVLILLGVISPDTDGYSICTEIRRCSQIPVIMLSSRNQESDRLLAFEKGADDYLCKPFNPRELIFRIKAILRRTNDLPPPKFKTLPGSHDL